MIKKVIFKDCTLFSDCISEINNTKVDNVKDPDIVIPIYNLSKIVIALYYCKLSANSLAMITRIGQKLTII